MTNACIILMNNNECFRSSLNFVCNEYEAQVAASNQFSIISFSIVQSSVARYEDIVTAAAKRQNCAYAWCVHQVNIHGVRLYWSISRKVAFCQQSTPRIFHFIIGSSISSFFLYIRTDIICFYNWEWEIVRIESNQDSFFPARPWYYNSIADAG